MDECNFYEEHICDICGKIFNKFNSKIGLKKHKIWCEKKADFIKKYNITKEKLINEYDELGSVLEFQKKYPHWNNFFHYYKLFKEFEVNVSVKHALNNKNVIKKRINNNLLKYGVSHNFSKNHPSRKKWEKELFEKEGITNVFQRKEVKEKSLNTILKKYEKELWLHSITLRGKGVISNLNKKIFNILDENNIKYSIEFKIKRTKYKYYSYDILLENNKIIEINGDYWHGNPVLYKENDILLKGSSKELLVKDKWKLDNDKINFIKNLGYDVLIIWEYDLKNNLNETINKIINYGKN